jgi:hypothetical protein
VQKALRHAKASTTLDTYTHLWPDDEDAATEVTGAVIKARMSAADDLRTDGSS